MLHYIKFKRLAKKYMEIVGFIDDFTHDMKGRLFLYELNDVEGLIEDVYHEALLCPIISIDHKRRLLAKVTGITETMNMYRYEIGVA